MIRRCQCCGALEGDQVNFRRITVRVNPKTGRESYTLGKPTTEVANLAPTDWLDYGRRLACQGCISDVARLNRRVIGSHLTVGM
jgi:hypothetical protein